VELITNDVCALNAMLCSAGPIALSQTHAGQHKSTHLMQRTFAGTVRPPLSRHISVCMIPRPSAKETALSKRLPARAGAAANLRESARVICCFSALLLFPSPQVDVLVFVRSQFELPGAHRERHMKRPMWIDGS